MSLFLLTFKGVSLQQKSSKVSFCQHNLSSHKTFLRLTAFLLKFYFMSLHLHMCKHLVKYKWTHFHTVENNRRWDDTADQL